MCLITSGKLKHLKVLSIEKLGVATHFMRYTLISADHYYEVFKTDRYSSQPKGVETIFSQQRKSYIFLLNKTSGILHCLGVVNAQIINIWMFCCSKQFLPHTNIFKRKLRQMLFKSHVWN